MGKKVAIYTLGCKVNQYESRVLMETFEENGFKAVDFSDVADVYVINTCSVTGVSDKKSRQMIKRAIRKNAEALVCVTGCYAQVSKEEIERIEGVDIVMGTKDRLGLVALVERNLGQKTRIVHVDDISQYSDFEPMKLSYGGEKTRISIKIQDGCQNFCSYCIIPYARGPVRSKQFGDIKTELLDIIAHGYREVVLTGIHISSYGMDLKDGHSLLDVLQMANALDGEFRIRLGSMNLSCFTPEFINGISRLKKLCAHFHISLQSGSKNTLSDMNRNYTPQEFLRVLNDLRTAIPDVAVTTDVIVGFPGESQADFLESLQFVKGAGFAKVHVFPYSIRKGTRAADMAGQIEKQEKERRAKLMAQADEASHMAFLEKQVGRNVPVLFEECVRENIYQGLTPNYQMVRVKSDVDIAQQVRCAHILEIKEQMLYGELIDTDSARC